MIKVNLLTVERRRARKKAFDSTRRVTVGCVLILLGAALAVGWRYWTLAGTSAQLDRDIGSAQREAAQLHSVIAQVQQFEQQRAQLQQRVGLIEQLRREQAGPVHMLDQISRALPPTLWLTELAQTENPNEVVISGKCTTLTSLSDFVSNLEASGYFKRSVEIVKSELEAMSTPPGEVVAFSIRAVFQGPGGQAAPAVAADAKKSGSKGQSKG
jgi:type IV pilus assembly protein PilN